MLTSFRLVGGSFTPYRCKTNPQKSSHIRVKHSVASDDDNFQLSGYDLVPADHPTDAKRDRVQVLYVQILNESIYFGPYQKTGPRDLSGTLVGPYKNRKTGP